MLKADKGSEKRRIIILSLSFLIPMIIYLVVLCVLGFFPNGDKTVLFMDLKGEYTEYLASLRYIFDGDNSLLFNWSRSMGGNAVGLYAFYSGGIFAFISCLFPLKMIYAAMEFIIILMIGLCGLSMAVFLEWGISRTKGNYSVIVFSVCYALMSYVCVYCNCLMWLNGVIWMPLIFLGIEQILAGKKGLVFYISLSLSMINNYYTAYMICIFSVLYMAFRMITLYKSDKEKHIDNKKELAVAGVKYISLAVLSALTAAPVLFTVVKDLIGGKLTSASDFSVDFFYYPFSETFKKLLPKAYDSITTENIHPQLYAGLIPLIFAMLFFIRKNIRMKEKVAAAAVIGIMLISFWCVELDRVWHGFQYPHWFPFRYAFVFGFFMVYLGFRAYDDTVTDSFVKKLSKKYKRDPLNINCVISIVLLAVCSIELGANAANYINGLGDDFGYMQIGEYEDFYDKTKPLTDKVRAADGSWYRMDKDYEFSKNDSMLFGYRGMTHYSSTYNARVNMLTPRLGLAQSWYWNSGYGATPLVDALFGVKYRLCEKAMPSVYNKLDENGSVTLYENPLALPIGFQANRDVTALVAPTGDVFSNQNEVMNKITGDERAYFTPLEYNRTDAEGESILEFKAVSDDPVYLYMDPVDGWWGDIFVNDAYVNNYFSTETTCAVFLGEFTAGETVRISVRSDNASFDRAYIYSLDMDELGAAADKLKAGGLRVTSFGPGSVEGTIELGEESCIATTLPYEDGYSVYVDGEKCDYKPWADTFIAIEAPPGKHTVSIAYTPSGFIPGIICMCAAVLIAAGWFMWSFIMKKIKRGKENDS